MLRRTLLEIGAMMALGANYAAVCVIAFVWGPDAFARVGGAHSELLIYILILFIVSLLFGALIIDMKKTLFYTIGSIVIGIALATAIISAPSVMSPGDIILLDFSITVALATVSRLFVVGITFMIVGAILGSFVGDMVSELPET